MERATTIAQEGARDGRESPIPELFVQAGRLCSPLHSRSHFSDIWITAAPSKVGASSAYLWLCLQ
jgi:hypothetical protein